MVIPDRRQLRFTQVQLLGAHRTHWAVRLRLPCTKRLLLGHLIIVWVPSSCCNGIEIVASIYLESRHIERSVQIFRHLLKDLFSNFFHFDRFDEWLGDSSLLLLVTHLDLALIFLRAERRAD